MIERQARLLAGYLQGQRIADDVMTVLANCTADNVDQKIGQYLAEKNDPRLTEIVNILLAKTMAALTGTTTCPAKVDGQQQCEGCAQ
ncbi:hypothetical protein [Shewanella marina]|uniref:hypothetical protein n=1 Tax=Shewanella marina TaxID=487319 RepID=UPI000AF4DE57|nr:hypothetical protein [Shewanella marina]